MGCERWHASRLKGAREDPFRDPQVRCSPEHCIVGFHYWGVEEEILDIGGKATFYNGYACFNGLCYPCLSFEFDGTVSLRCLYCLIRVAMKVVLILLGRN